MKVYVCYTSKDQTHMDIGGCVDDSRINVIAYKHRIQAEEWVQRTKRDKPRYSDDHGIDYDDAGFQEIELVT